MQLLKSILPVTRLSLKGQKTMGACSVNLIVL